jgi:hypothetical protein
MPTFVRKRAQACFRVYFLHATFLNEDPGSCVSEQKLEVCLRQKEHHHGNKETFIPGTTHPGSPATPSRVQRL